MLQLENIYVREHTRDAQLTVEELKDMVGSEGEAFSSRVLRYAGHKLVLVQTT